MNTAERKIYEAEVNLRMYLDEESAEKAPTVTPGEQGGGRQCVGRGCGGWREPCVIPKRLMRP